MYKRKDKIKEKRSRIHCCTLDGTLSLIKIVKRGHPERTSRVRGEGRSAAQREKSKVAFIVKMMKK